MRVTCALESRTENGTETYVVAVTLTRADQRLLLTATSFRGVGYKLPALLRRAVQTRLEVVLGRDPAARKGGRS